MQAARSAKLEACRTPETQIIHAFNGHNRTDEVSDEFDREPSIGNMI